MNMLKSSFTIDNSEVSRCLLCNDPPCTKACPQNADVGKALRSIYFSNPVSGFQVLNGADCTYCNAPCENACVLKKSKPPVEIRNIFMDLKRDMESLAPEKLDGVDITTDICGVKLENPFLLSSSVVASTYDMCKRAFEAGWAGVSFKTICNFPQHEASPRFSAIHNHSVSFCGFKNIEQLSDHSVVENMEIFKRLKKEFPTKVIVASIMGQNEDEWTMLATECEKAGASVIECNFSCPNMESADLGITIGQNAELIEKFTRATKKGTKLPVLAKMTPNITDMVPMALAAKSGGADGIAAINTINSITGVDLRTLTAEPSVRGKSIIGGYSGPAVKPIALRFISELAGCKELQGMHISGMGGIETWEDAMEFILLGSGSLQVTTSVMQYGYRIIEDLIAGTKIYMRRKGIPNLRSMIGAAAGTVVDHQSIERDTILFPIIDHKACNGCGRCYVSCMDGGHQAITLDPQTGLPKVDGSKCVGCHLCALVCPMKCIGSSHKAIKANH